MKLYMKKKQMNKVWMRILYWICGLNEIVTNMALKFGLCTIFFPSLFCFVLFFWGVGVGSFFQLKPHIQLKVLFQVTASVKSDKVDFLIDGVRSRISGKEVWKRHLWWWLHPYSCLLCSRFFECGHWYFLFGEERERKNCFLNTHTVDQWEHSSRLWVFSNSPQST